MLDTLSAMARYDGPWKPLRKEQALLETRLVELRERHSRLDDVLVVALVGGSGVGKSTLLNALAGDILAKTSEYRPCTSKPTIYHPPGVVFDFEDAHHVSGSALEQLVIVDTPDSDTILREHREVVARVLNHCDLVFICASSEKYLDEATWSLLRPLRAERAFLCIETKAESGGEIRADWLGRLEAAGFEIADYFQVRALRSLDRKLAGAVATDEELDFPKLEAYLREVLDADRIARIKRSNAAGLLSKTVQQIDGALAKKSEKLVEMEEEICEAERCVRKDALASVSSRLCGEAYLWTNAVGREVARSAKGVSGTLFRAVEALHVMPGRLAGWTPRGEASGEGGALFSGASLFHEELARAANEAAGCYERERSALELDFSKAGFGRQGKRAAEAAQKQFRDTIVRRIEAVLRGPARDEVQHRARFMTAWPVTIALELPVLLFFVYAAYRIVTSYFGGAIMDAGFLLHTVAVFCILLGAEVIAMRMLVRWLASLARRAAAKAVEEAFDEALDVFAEERAALAEAKVHADASKRLRAALSA